MPYGCAYTQPSDLYPLPPHTPGLPTTLPRLPPTTLVSRYTCRRLFHSPGWITLNWCVRLLAFLLGLDMVWIVLVGDRRFERLNILPHRYTL